MKKIKFLAMLLTTSLVAMSLSGCSGSAISASTGSSAESEEVASTAGTAEGQSTASETADTSVKDADTIKIGVLYSTTGSFSLSETPMYNATKLAIDEINANGGIAGKQIEPVYADYGSDPAKASEKVQQLILEDEVLVITGSNSSSTRLAVAPVVEEHNAVLFYNTYYEGETPSPNIIYTNTVPSQQVYDYIPWMIENFGPKIFCVGSDYVFPKKEIEFAKKRIEECGGELVGEEYAPNGHTEFSSIINKIKAAGPDVVFSAVAGDSVVSFVKQYKQYGIDMEEIPMCTIATHEAGIKGIGIEAAEGLYSSFDYFNTLDTSESKAFVEAYTAAFGTDTTVTNLAEGAYHGVYLIKAALEKAENWDTQSIIDACAGLEIATPGGTIRMDETNHHAWLNCYIGKVNSEGTFDIVYKSESPLEPIAE